ncbi:MAG: DUF362 domain-containing protein [Verrucomicrobia subdivision 3 bacterium]|nr:DUF362 domain-containing protein [Limisphaerales bacterium]
MSRNAQVYVRKWLSALLGIALIAPAGFCQGALSYSPSRVVKVYDPAATDAFRPRSDIVSNMLAKAIVALTGQSNADLAWRSLVTTQDMIGIKVYSSPGASSGTRSAVAAAAVEGLLSAGIKPERIIVWDKHRGDLRRSGFFELGERYGVRVEGSMDRGYDEKTFYETPLIGHLVWGDLEFGKSGERIGRRSFVSKLVAQEITKIINVTPLLNHNAAAVCGNLFSLAIGSVDNTMRFEADPARLAEAVPEIYALPVLGDRVVLNITDALICQYQGEQRTLLHYSAVLNELRLSRDPVALDVLSIRELELQRLAAKMPAARPNRDLYENAELLELGIADPDQVKVERVRE